MRTIINELRVGDASRKLSIISDLATLTSVILVWLLVPAFSLALGTELSLSAIATVSIFVLLAVAGSAIALAVFLSIDSWLSARRAHVFLFRVALWCVALSVALVTAAFIHDLMVNTYWV